MAEGKMGFNVFSIHDEVTYSRVGKNVTLKGRDGTLESSNTVEANLLLDILKALKKK
jgi:hypothetical protein